MIGGPPRLKDIPRLERGGRNLDQFAESVQEALQTFRGTRGEKIDKALTPRDLLPGGEWQTLGGGGAPGPTGLVGPPGPPGGGGAIVPDLTPPPTPTVTSVTAGITNLYIEIIAPVYTQGHGHRKTNFYGAKRPTGAAAKTFNDAILIGEAFDARTIYVHPTEPATRWAIWVTFMTKDGVESVTPAGGANGFETTTGQDVALLLTALTGQITESQLFSTLGQRIDLIDGAMAGSVNARIATEATSRVNGDTASASLVTTLQSSIAGAGGNRLRNSGMETPSSSTPSRAAGWFVYNNSPGTEPSTLSLVGGRLGGLAQRITWAGANTSTKGVIASQSFDGASLGGVIGGWKPNTTYVVSWYARSNTTVNAANGMELAWNTPPSVTTVLASPTLDAAEWRRYAFKIVMGAAVEVAGTIYISVQYGAGGQTGYVEVDDVQVQEGNLLTGYAPGDQSELVAAVQTEATTRANADGSLFAQYTVKLDVNGYVSGFGLASTSTGAAPFSSFIVRADSFSIASPSGPGITPIVPFIVRTIPGTVNGVAYPSGVYIDSAYILDLTAAIARMGTAWIDDAKIGSLSAGKLTVGDGTIGGNLKSSNYVAGFAGWLLQPNGTAEFGFAAIRGTLLAGQIGANYITTLMLAANSVTATQIAAGAVTAIKINVASLDAITATIGLLRTATSGARQEIASSYIKVFDSSNVKRVQLGDLTA